MCLIAVSLGKPGLLKTNQMMRIIDSKCLQQTGCLTSLTTVQKTQLQLCSSLVAADGCSLRHSLQKTSGPQLGWAPTSGVPGAESRASCLRVGLLLAMLERGMQGGGGCGIRQLLTLLLVTVRSYSIPSCSWKQTQCGCVCLFSKTHLIVTVHTATSSQSDHTTQWLLVTGMWTGMTSLFPKAVNCHCLFTWR